MSRKDETTETDEKITPDDLRAKFAELAADVEEKTEAAKSYALATGAGVVVLVFAVAFLSGKRRGRKKSTVVEIRRI